MKKLSSFGRVGDVEITTVNALSLFIGCKENWHAYQLIRDKQTNSKDFLFLKFFLLGRSLELGFKVLIRAKEGKSIEEIKKNFGHRISDLLKYCVEQKYISFTKNEQEKIKQLSKEYQSKLFEYIEIRTVELPTFEVMEKIVGKLVTNIEELFQNQTERKYL